MSSSTRITLMTMRHGNMLRYKGSKSAIIINASLSQYRSPSIMSNIGRTSSSSSAADYQHNDNTKISFTPSVEKTKERIASRVQRHKNSKKKKKSKLGLGLGSGSGSGSGQRSSSLSASSDIELMTDLNLLKSIVGNMNKTTPLTLSNMYKYASIDRGQRLRNAQFLHCELPIRIADRALDLLTLPNGLSSTRQIRNVAHKYITFLKQLNSFPLPKTAAEEREFTVLLSELVLDRTSIPHAIARGVQSLKDKRRETMLDSARLQEVEDALYRFFTARVGLRFLTEHHILGDVHSPQATLLRKQHTCLLDDECTLHDTNSLNYTKDNHFAGCIQKNCDPVKEIAHVVKQVTRLCVKSFGIAPPIQLVDCTTNNSKQDFCYVPHHLQYMVAELLKNSCRATIRKHLQDQHTSNVPSPIPAIKIVVVKGEEDVTIKIADRGGGVSRSQLVDIWTFTKSRLPSPEDTSDTPKNDYDFCNNLLSGTDIREFGLPLARIYARYFGGEITLKSCEGVGLDAYLYLPVLGEACENLPEKVASSPGNLDSSISSENHAMEEVEMAASSPSTHLEKNGATIDELCQRAL